MTKFDSDRVRIIGGETVITMTNLSFLRCRRSTFIEDHNHRPKPQLLLITTIIQG